MAQERNTNKGYGFTAILITIGIIILAIAIVIFVFGVRGILKIILTIIQILVILTLLFALLYLFYHLFIKKQKYDVNYVNKRKMIEAGTRQHRDTMKDLYITGDKTHSRVCIGKITGYIRIQILSRNYLFKETTTPDGITKKEYVMEEDDRGNKKPIYTLDKQEQDVFITKPKGLAGWFADPMVIRVNPEDHDELVGDISLYGYSLIPISEYYFLNNDMLDVRKIDYAILKEAERTIAFVTLSDMKELIDNATGVDASHKKGIEQKSLVEIPELQKVGTTGQYG
jgi:hypothetical protein